MPRVDPPNEAGAIDGLQHIDSTLRAAIQEQSVVSFMLNGRHRVAEPHDYGVIGGKTKLFCYQIGGSSRSSPPTGWRWAELAKLSDLKVLDQHFAGPRAAPSGQHVRWEKLFASVSSRERRTERRDLEP